jgi:hypothetical protein
VVAEVEESSGEPEADRLGDFRQGAVRCRRRCRRRRRGAASRPAESLAGRCNTFLCRRLNALLSFVGKEAELKVVIGRNGPSHLLWEAARPNYPWGGEPTLTAFVWWTICTLAAAVPVGYAERRMLMTVSSSPGNLMAFLLQTCGVFTAKDASVLYLFMLNVYCVSIE